MTFQHPSKPCWAVRDANFDVTGVRSGREGVSEGLRARAIVMDRERERVRILDMGGGGGEVILRYV